MYHDLMDAPEPRPTPSDLYDHATSDVSVAEEIRLARSRLGKAVIEDNDKDILSWLAMVHALVRIESGLGENHEGELAQFLTNVGTEIADELAGKAGAEAQRN